MYNLFTQPYSQERMIELRDSFNTMLNENKVFANCRCALPGAKGAYSAVNSTWAEREAEVQLQNDAVRL